MKKNYICPKMEVTVLAFSQQLLAGSVVGNAVLSSPADSELDVLAPEMDLDAYFE